ncbi:unnamed protein product [Mortierella alpina]
MDSVVSYEHQNAKDMLKNRTLKDYTPQLGIELDALSPSTSNSGASLDLGFTVASAENNSIPLLLSSMNQFLQNVDAASGSNGANAGLGLRFLPSLRTFGAQGNENVDIPSFIVPAFLTFAFILHHFCGNQSGRGKGTRPKGASPEHGHQAIHLLSGAIRDRLDLLLGPSGGVLHPYGSDASSDDHIGILGASQSVGQVLGIGMSLVVFVPYFIVQFVYGGASLLAIVLIGFISPSFALERSISAIALAQTTGAPYSVGDTFDIKRAPFCSMILFVVQSILYLLLISWIENLIQTRRSPIDFFFRRGASKGAHAASQKERDASESEPQPQRQDTAVLMDGKYRERDAEVIEEALRLKGKAGSQDEKDSVRLLGLSKVFHLASKNRDLVILDDMYLSFKKNECFGYLGPNGAGKTTTIKILTGAEGPTSGGGTIEGLPIAPFHEDLRSMIGICPQFDVIWPKLTVRDHLELFAKIKGVAPDDVNPAIDQMIEEMGLAGVGDKRAATFSGGNKRRLSLAMAVIGCPKVVFLDEPTTGVDVSIRQAIWNSIRKLKRSSCVVLTTHSMEEADALCDRIGIITNGHIQALGTSQRLKNTYGAGYKVIVKTHHHARAVTSALEQAVGGGRVTLIQALGMSLEYELTRVEGERTTEMLSKLFRLFEQKRQELGIEDYSVSQTTLAQVFIEFAKEQAAPEDTK